jgi:hypothetical protein
MAVAMNLGRCENDDCNEPYSSCDDCGFAGCDKGCIEEGLQDVHPVVETVVKIVYIYISFIIIPYTLIEVTLFLCTGVSVTLRRMIIKILIHVIVKSKSMH